MMHLKLQVHILRQRAADSVVVVENAKNAVATASENKKNLATALAAAVKTFADASLAFSTAAGLGNDTEDLLEAMLQARRDKEAAFQNAAKGDVAFSQAELCLQTAEQELKRINAEVDTTFAEYTQMEEEETAKKAAAEAAEKKQKQLALEKIAQEEAAAAAKKKQTQRTIVDEAEEEEEAEKEEEEEEEEKEEEEDMDIEDEENGDNDWKYRMPVIDDNPLGVEMADELQLKELAKFIGRLPKLKKIKVERIGQKPKCICCGKLAHAYKNCNNFETIEGYVALFRRAEERVFDEFAEQIFADNVSQRKLQACMETSHAYLRSVNEKNRTELEEFPLCLQTDKHCQICLEVFKSKAKALAHRKSYNACPITYVLALLLKKQRKENVDAFYGDDEDESDAEVEVAAPPAKKSKKMALPKVVAAVAEVEAVEAEAVEAVEAETEDAKLIAIVAKFDGAMYRMNTRIAALEEDGKAKDQYIRVLQGQMDVVTRDLDAIRQQSSQEMHTPAKRIRTDSFAYDDFMAESIDPQKLTKL